MLLLAVCVSLATWLEPRMQGGTGHRADAAGVLQVLLGEGRRLFANHFFVKADAYFHSGYYPSIFDAPVSEQGNHLVAGVKSAVPDESKHAVEPKTKSPNPKHGEPGHKHEDHDEEPDFLGQPRDWIERVGRHFFVSHHTHLDESAEGGEAREILPWLRLSASLDPNHVDTYIVASFWLRTKLGKMSEAEQFLREGLRANSNSPELLFELGRVFSENREDTTRARNLWELALDRWRKQEANKDEPNKFLLLQITSSLALLERTAGNYDRSLTLMQLWRSVSPRPEEVDKWIADVKARMAPAK